MGLNENYLVCNDSRSSYKNSVQFVSRHIEALPASKREKLIAQCLNEFNRTDIDEEYRQYLSDTIVLQTWYLFPYILRNQKFKKGLFEEALQNMVVNTLKAIKNFDPEKGSKFSSYLFGYLKDAISSSIKDSYVVRSPSSVYKKKIQELKDAKEDPDKDENKNSEGANEDENDAENDAEDVAPDSYAHEDMSDDYADRVPRLSSQEPDTIKEVTSALKSLSGVYVDDMDYSSCSKFTDSTTLEAEMYRRRVYELLEKVFKEKGNGVYNNEYDVLNFKEQVVIKYRYGIFGQGKMTLDEVAFMFRNNGFNGTKEWIHQIEKNARHKLKLFLQEHGVHDTTFLDE